MKVMKITAVKDKKPGLCSKNISGTLGSLQKEVGGLITTAPYFDELEDKNIVIFADDEGLLKDNPVPSLCAMNKNNKVTGILVGNIIFAGTDEDGNTLGLTDEQEQFILQHIHAGHIMQNNRIIRVFTFVF